MVARRIYQRLKLREGALQFAGQPFPGLIQSSHGHIAQAHYDGEEGVEVLEFLATIETNKQTSSSINYYYCII